jgi:acyl dehydratase
MSERPVFYFEDFHVGRRFVSRGVTLSEADILEFAYKYDPQPFHIDKTAAEQSHFGGLIASGFQTLCAAFRMIIQENLFTEASMGSPGMDEVRWLKPVYPGDTLRIAMEVVESAPSRSRSDRGRIRAAYTITNQHDVPVMTFTAVQILKRRPDPDSDVGAG